MLPGKGDQLLRSQQQLIEVVNEAVHPVDVDKIEAEVRNVAKNTFSGEDWPDDLEPLPSLRMRLAGVFRTRNQTIEALSQGIRGCLWSERRIGDTWVRNLSDLLQVIAHAVLLPKHSTATRIPRFPNQEQLWDVLHGYLHELVHSAIKTFGCDASYTKAIQGWYSDCMRSANGPKPGTRAFAERFKRAQSELLICAGVDGSRGIALT